MSFLDSALGLRPSCELATVGGSTAQTLTTSFANLNLWLAVDTPSLWFHRVDSHGSDDGAERGPVPAHR